MIHQLKTTTGYFDDIAKGLKPFEVRENDRGFSVGDFLALNEYDELTEKETGRCVLVEVVYVLNDRNFCRDGQVIMGIRPCWISRATDQHMLNLSGRFDAVAQVPAYGRIEVAE
jgi:hypothetical protein